MIEQALFVDFPDAVAIIEPETRTFMDCNDTALEQTGYSREEFIGLPILELEHNGTAERIQAVAEKVLAEGSSVLTVDIRTKSGAIKTLFVHLARFEYEGRNLIRAIMHDVTTSKVTEEQLEESEEQYRSLVEASPDIIMEIDLTGTILYVNRVLKGARNEDAIGTNFLDYLPSMEHTRVRKLLDRSFTRQRNTEFEVSVVTPFGTRWWKTRALPQEKDGIVKGFLLITSDVTDTKRAQDSLGLSEERYRNLVERSPLPLIVHRYGYLKYINPKAAQLLGLQGQSELEGVHVRDFIHADDRSRVNRQFPINYVLDEPARKSEFRLIRADGEERDILASGIVINYEGELSRMLMLDDVTEKVEALNELSLSEERYRSLVENSPQPIFVHRQGRFVFGNRILCSLLGIENVEEVVGKSVLDFLHEDDRDRMISVMPSTYSLDDKPVKHEFKMNRADGETRDLVVSLITVNFEGELARLAVLNDVTERKRVEEALRKSEQQYRHLVENSPQPIFIHREGRFVYLNKKLYQLLGIKSDDGLVGRSVFDFVYEEDKARLIGKLPTTYELTDTAINFEFRLQPKDGDVRDIVASLITVNFEGELARMAILNDVTERKQAEDALKASDQRYRYLAEHMRDAVFLMDMNWQHQYVSPSIEKIRGFTVEDIFELPIQESLPPDSLANAQELLAGAMEQNGLDENGDPLVFTFEQEEYCKDGSKVWTEVKAGFVYDDEKNPVGIIGCTRDISDRKEKEKVIEKQRESLKQIIELNPYPILILDRDGYAESCNKAYEKLFTRMPPKEYNALDDKIVFGLGHAEKLKRAREGEVVQFPEIEYNPSNLYPEIKAPDITVNIRVTSFPVRNPDGGIENYVFMFDDITESRKAEAELRDAEERYRTVVENIQLGVIMYKGLEVTYANDTARNLFEVDKSKGLTGRHVMDLIYEGDREYLLEKMKEEGVDMQFIRRIKHRVNTKDGVRWIESKAMTVQESGKPTRIVFFSVIDEPPDGVSWEVVN